MDHHPAGRKLALPPPSQQWSPGDVQNPGVEMGECGEVEVEVEREQEDQVQHYSPLLGKAKQEKPDAGLPVH